MHWQRLFFAIELPLAARRALAAVLPARSRGLKASGEEGMHLTLRFVGPASEGAIEAVRAALRLATVGAFTLPIEGAGQFPPRGAPRVVWAGVGAGHPRLYQLRQLIDDALLREAVECDLREFVPHVTLARVERGGEGAAVAALKALADWEGPVVKVSEYCLFESVPDGEGRRYEVVERFELRD